MSDSESSVESDASKSRSCIVVRAWAAVVIVHGVMEFTPYPYGPLLGVLLMPILFVLVIRALIRTLRTIAAQWPSRSRRWTAILVAVPLMAAVSVQPLKWGVFEPRSYFYTHYPLFAGIASELDEYGLDGNPDVVALDYPFSMMSLTTDARLVGRCIDVPVYYVPQWLGIPDDGWGYIYFRKDDVRITDDCLAFLDGRVPQQDDIIELSGGWYYG